MKNSLALSRLFSWAWCRHLENINDHNSGEYEVCSNLVCRVVFGIENWLWYDRKM